MAAQPWDEYVVESWNELNDHLFSSTYNKAINRHRSTFAYRGVGVADYSLTTSLMRLGDPYDGMERNLIKQFKKYAYGHVSPDASEWHSLAIAQHYGLPTRLLDWTYAPLVAVHFATNDVDLFDQPAAIWKVNFSDAHELLSKKLTSQLDDLGARIFSVDALATSAIDIEGFERHGGELAEFALFFEPPAIDDRIVNQFAYFSVLTDPTLAFEDWLRKPNVAGKVAATKIVIPAELKWEVRDKLDQSNLNERVLMTGLGGLCSWLKRHYTPRAIEI